MSQCRVTESVSWGMTTSTATQGNELRCSFAQAAEMFYFFFESRGNPGKDPVVLWMTGKNLLPQIACQLRTSTFLPNVCRSSPL